MTTGEELDYRSITAEGDQSRSEPEITVSQNQRPYMVGNSEATEATVDGDWLLLEGDRILVAHDRW